jgi:hypothetical protein
MPDAATTADPQDPAPTLTWLLPGQQGTPAICLQRIRWICEHVPDLYCAAITVAATHQGVPRDQLAAALRQFRPELQVHSPRDVTGMVNGLWHGAKDGFEAVLRTRKTSDRRSSALPFVRPD